MMASPQSSPQSSAPSSPLNELSQRNRHKIVFIGPSSAGKTSLIQRFAKGLFQEHQPTIGTAFYSREVSTPRGNVVLNVWDTAGMEQYKALVPRYSRGASAAVFVFDVTEPASFQSARDLVIDSPNTTGEDVLKFFVGNKIDCQYGMDICEAREFAEQQHLGFWETSAKTGENVDELFGDIGFRVASMQQMPVGIDLLTPVIEDGNGQNVAKSDGCC
jgi:Ras-related protein Rab-5C